MSDLAKIIKRFDGKKGLKPFLRENFSDGEYKRLVKMITFVNFIRSGRTFNDAAKGVPIAAKTAKLWLQKAEAAIDLCDANDFDYDEHEDYMYIDFKMCYDEFESEFKYKLQDNILEHSKDVWLEDENGNKIQLQKKGDWKAAEKVLKSRFPEDFSDNESGGGNQQQVGVIIYPTINAQDMSIEDLSSITQKSQQYLLNKIEEEDKD